ncbi:MULTISPECIES: DEAD/DEAH box helicase [unclassified Aurantimonas]|uniref:DEAD/DEAH box helicase n=1 Tax=unclassified Aurantimonas TaxID=2638230 RepID=UPI002E1797F7|nr:MULTISPECIES: DEAD/DEAH box helicase [unclassified Aurantimonas]MEC5293527.1 DEAD/DEAH box helicase [Aurantimonas sp. C2-3-R2]MEC5414308.1 DEAD/DEAH box helicase [Aurantimonas sp. C2-4-R8]
MDVSGSNEDGGLIWPSDLFPFQKAGVDRLLRQPSLLLADEMGLGKTIQAIAALRILRSADAVRQALVVAPAGLVLQWRAQFRRWAPELKLSTVVGPTGERAAAWAAVADVYLVGYEALRSDVGLRGVAGPGNRRWDVVVIDEAQRIKNAGTGTSDAVRRLHRDRSWALTGTPLENRLDDLLTILDFVAPGRFDPNGMLVGLRRLLGEVQLRRRRHEVLSDLPPKLASIVPLRLGPRQQAAYQRAEKEGLMRLERLGTDLTITHVLELILRLKQICNFCPESGESPKLDDMRERLDAAAQRGEKALVFSQFVAEPFGAHRLARELFARSPVVLTGAVAPALRAQHIADFGRDPNRQVMILSLRAGGLGLNLTQASHVFHFDRWWNPAVEAQAEDRAHRIGQHRPVHVYAYLCSDTIEERIQEILTAKRQLFADVIDGLDARTLGRLDLETLLSIVKP